MTDSVVLVTGGAGNVGRAVTRSLLASGARVAVPFYKTDLPTALDELRSEFGERLNVFALDLTTERGAEQAVQQVMEWAGRLDSVAHLVGGYAGGARIAEMSLEAWEGMIDLNLRSAWLVSHFAIPALISSGGGSLVFVSSRAALEGRQGHVAYAIAKGGLLTLAEGISEEYREQGIRANAVLPGIIDTPENRQAMPGSDSERWTKPEEVARIICYLASPQSAPISGAAVPVYGLS